MKPYPKMSYLKENIKYKENMKWKKKLLYQEMRLI